MKGIVDDELRALIEVSIGNSRGGSKSVVMVWVDTAFNGGLVLPRRVIEVLELQEYSSTSAILADGQQVELPTFTCFLEWFGNEYRTQVIANDGAHPLLGTMLLDGHDLSVSYKRRTVELNLGDERLKSPMLRGIGPPLANDLTRNFGAFCGSSLVLGLRLYMTEATDE